MTRTRRFLGGLTTGYVYQVVVTLVGLWLTAFLLRELGAHDYGLWLVATQILGYLLLTDLGIVALLPRETAYATGRAGGLHEDAGLPLIVGRTARLVAWQMPVVALGALLVWVLLPREWLALRNPLALVLVVFVLTFPMRVLHGVLTGLQDLTFLGAAQMALWFAGTATTIVLALAGYGLHSLAVGWVVAQVLAAAVWWTRIRLHFPTVLPARIPRIGWREASAYLSKSGWVSVAQVAQVLLAGSDLLIIANVLGPVAAVPYACTAKLVAVFANQPQVVMQAAAPALSELRTAGSPAHMVRVSHALTQAMLILSGFFACLVAATNEGFVTWWVGEGQYGGFALTAVLILVMLLRHWNTTAVYSIFAFGYERRISLTMLGDGVVTITAAILLIPRLGLLGAPIASLLGVSLASLPANLAALAKETGQAPWRVAAHLGPWFWRFLLTLALATATAPLLASGTLISLVLGATGIGAVYVALMLPLALRDPLGAYVRPRLTAIRARWSPALRRRRLRQ